MGKGNTDIFAGVGVEGVYGGAKSSGCNVVVG